MPLADGLMEAAPGAPAGGRRPAAVRATARSRGHAVGVWEVFVPGGEFCSEQMLPKSGQRVVLSKTVKMLASKE